MKICKTAISAIFPDFRPEKNIFLKIRLDDILSIVNTHLCAKNQKKLMIKSRENAKKPVFRHIYGIFGRKKYLFQKSGTVTF